jgi:hypothetical protein
MAAQLSRVFAGAVCGIVGLPWGSPALGQDDPHCRTELTPELAARAWAQHASGAYRIEHRPEGVVYVPLTFHVVRRSDGTWPWLPGMGQERLQGALDIANEHFAPAGIQFCRVGPIRYIDSDQYHHWQTGASYQGLFSIDPVPGTINCYFTRNAPACGRSSFSFSPLPHGIVMPDWCTPLVGRYSPVFSHELGHYFDLFHTFETMFGVECTSGSNCDVAGDLVCDTPADHGGGVDPNCKYVQGRMGPCPGDPLYDPDTRNIMSWYGSCRERFAPGQGERMMGTLLNVRTELDLRLCNRLCYADCDGNGVLDNEDFLCFQSAFLAGEPYADCDGSGTLDFFDFLCFQNEFLAGCQ